MERDLIPERTKSALDAKCGRGERVGGRRPTHTPEQVKRAMHMLETGDMTGSGDRRHGRHEPVADMRAGRPSSRRAGCHAITDELLAGLLQSCVTEDSALK